MSNIVTSTINLSPILNQLERVAQTTTRIETNLTNTNKRLDKVTGDLSDLSRELTALKAAFDVFMDDSKKAVTLQKAATELIRVRQELEQNFGGYKIVRETMLGVLQATDLALVKKTTIATVTEELMLSTPDYWLAPCLVAVAAWIGNDRDLANRAIKEALKRDEEKTALTMALICRRNNRTDTCFEWLSIYFAKQSADNFTESNFTYLNAYLNGVFGSDNKHMCEDYIAKWMREIQDHGEDFENEQTELWKEYCSEFTVDLEGQFPQMNGNVREYGDILSYVNRINSVGKIANNFSDMKNVAIDEEKMKRDVDQTLVSLISRCDEKEVPLRKEERYLLAVRYFDGDTEAAKRSVIEADRVRTEETIDLVSQMTNIIINRDDALPSERKTSVNFLSGYIRGGFNKYISEKRASFPRQITIGVDSWSGVTSDCSNIDALHRGYEMHMQTERQQKIDALSSSVPSMPAELPLALKILMWIIFPIGIFYTLYVNSIKNKRADTDMYIARINAEYSAKIAEGHRKIDSIAYEWNRAREMVYDFESRSFPDVVA